MNGESLNGKFYETQTSVKEPCFLSPGLKGKLVQDTSSVVPVIPLSPTFRYFYSLHSPPDWSTEGKGILTNSGKKKKKSEKKNNGQNLLSTQNETAMCYEFNMH